MGRSISKRYYFDYNATSPLAESVQSWLTEGNIPFGNPSSLHGEGRSARALMQEAKAFLLDFFGLPHYRIFFHSGATEGVNTLVGGFVDRHEEKGESVDFFSVRTDHSCVHNLRWKQKHRHHVLEVNSLGDFDPETLVKAIGNASGIPLFNFTWSNNESGVYWDLNLAEQIKRETKCFIHVDAVQAVGKIKDFRRLSPHLDAYTFSGHKFGSMKGVGFSLIHPDFDFTPCFHGGGQQEGMRSGTENVPSIYSLKLALQELQQVFDYKAMTEGKQLIENKLREMFGNEKGGIVGGDAQRRNGNTIYFFLSGENADTMLAAFDLAGIAVSGGSACSAGAVVPNRIMMAMGHHEDEARRGIRLSFSPRLTPHSAQEYWGVIKDVVQRFL